MLSDDGEKRNVILNTKQLSFGVKQRLASQEHHHHVRGESVTVT